jgi:hypothetical protein
MTGRRASHTRPVGAGNSDSPWTIAQEILQELPLVPMSAMSSADRATPGNPLRR